jgi:PAS domain S-box-containing protein
VGNLFFTGRKLLCIVLVLFTLTLLCQQVTAAPANKTITVVMDNDYPPYIFLDSSGNPQGILVDQWHLWEQKTGYTANISAMDWNEAQRRMDAGEYDVIDTLFYSDARALKYDFGKPYATIDVPLFFKKDLSGISDADSVKGFVVAVKSGDYAIDYLQSRGVTGLREYPSYEAIVAAAKTGEVVVFCIDKPPALYFLYKNGIQDQFRQTAPLYSGQFHRAVKKGDSQTLEIVEEGFNRITPAEYSAIEQKWYGTPIISNEYLQYVLAASIVIIVVLLLMVLWNHTLTKKINQKTADLRQEVMISTLRAEALKESEERYRLLFENNPAPMLIYERGTLRLLATNDAFQRFYGYSSDEALAMRLTDLYPDEEKGPITELAARLYGYASAGEWHHRRKDGSLMTIVAYSHDLVFKGSSARVAVMIDISDIRRAEEALRDSEALFRAVINNANDAIFLNDLSDHKLGTFIIVNDIAARWFGYTREELLHMSLPGVIPEHRFEKLFAYASQKIRTDGHAVFESFLTGKDGTEFPVEINTLVFPFREKMVALSIVRDITERKRAEEELKENERQLASIYETVGDVIFLLDVEADGNYRFASVNPAFSTVTGVPPESVIGKSVSEVIPEPSLSLVLGKYRQAISERTIVRWEEATLYSTGRLIGEVSVAPVFDKNGTCTHLVGSVHDITDRKKTEEALQLARKKLSLLNVVTFQDIQSALFSLSSYLELMKAGICDKTHLSYLEKSRNILTKTAGMMNFVKDYQNMGMTPPRWQNVSQVFLFAISHLPPLTTERIIAVDGLEMYADPLLETAFLNLVGSMQKHGTGATRIALRYEEPGDYLVLILEQNGAGVPAEEKEHFFERGYEDGHGHGLFFTREVLSITGITISETAPEGEGIRFEMLVPKGEYRFTKNP